MKPGNLILSIIGVILAGFAWMLFDSGSASAIPKGTPGRLRSALSSSKPVLVEFYADWCGPCKMVGPLVDKLAVDLKGKAEVVRLNVDEHGALSREYGVDGIPCFIAFKNGKETARQAGAIPPEMMRAMIGM